MLLKHFVYISIVSKFTTINSYQFLSVYLKKQQLETVEVSLFFSLPILPTSIITIIPREIMCIYIYGYLFTKPLFFGSAHGMQSFLGQGSNPCHSSEPSLCSDKVGTFTRFVNAFFFSEGQYHLFRDDGTVALICPQYGGFEISVSYADKFPIVFIAPCSSRVTSGPSLHAHGAGFFAVDQSQLTSPKEGSLFQGFKGPTLPKDLSHWFKGI